MTTELEQKFYDTFGIEPFTCCDEGCKTIGLAKNCEQCPYNKRQYPRLDNYIFLKLICICSSYVQNLDFDNDYIMLYEIGAKNIDDLKKEILEDCIDYAKANQEVKHQIQQLFRE